MATRHAKLLGVACPTCGGESREPIAPGYWKCTGLIAHRVATGLHPSGVFGPPFVDEFAPCNNRYQEGAPVTTPLCEHSTYSIGVCARCGEPVCGDRICSRIYNDKRHCVHCIAAIETEAQEARVRKADAQRARDDAARSEWLAKQRERFAGQPLPVTSVDAVAILFFEEAATEENALAARSLLKPLGVREFTRVFLKAASTAGRQPTSMRVRKLSKPSGYGRHVRTFDLGAVLTREGPDPLMLTTDGRFVGLMTSGIPVFVELDEGRLGALLDDNHAQRTAWLKGPKWV
jgi:hypothetical protein